MESREYDDLKKYFDRMPIAFMVADLILDERERPVDFIFRYANPALALLAGVELERLLGKRFFQEVFWKKHDKKWLEYYYASAFLHQTYELREFSPELGKYLKIICYPWSLPGSCACVLFDETALVEAERRMEYLANHDEPTKFHNRNAYMEFASQFEAGSRAGVIFVDLNGLKVLNDRWGHDAGDFLLGIARDRINSAFDGQEKKIFRIGGDEFVIVLPDVEQELCRQLVKALREQMKNDSIPYFPSILASVGWSWSDQADSLEKLVREADRAMYKEKRGYHDLPEG